MTQSTQPALVEVLSGDAMFDAKLLRYDRGRNELKMQMLQRRACTLAVVFEQNDCLVVAVPSA